MSSKQISKIFTHEQFGEVRIVIIDGTPWFVGKDVAQALGYSNTRKALIDHVPDNFKRIINAKTLYQMASQSKGHETGTFTTADLEFDSPRGLTFINEAGIYRLVLRSRLPAAEKFTDWTCEILVNVRKTGAYIIDDERAKYSKLLAKHRDLKREYAELEDLNFTLAHELDTLGQKLADTELDRNELLSKLNDALSELVELKQKKITGSPTDVIRDLTAALKALTAVTDNPELRDELVRCAIKTLNKSEN